MPIHRRTAVVDGLVTSYLESGTGDPVVLLHGGEFGASAELGWEHNIVALAKRYRVLAPDLLGFGQSAKVVDFVDGRGMRIRHVARFCDVVGVDSAHFAGNSMGAIMLLTDATSDAPGCRSAPWRSSAAGGRFSRIGTSRPCSATTPRWTGCAVSWRRCSTMPAIRPTRTMCGAAISRALFRERGKPWRQRVVAALALSRSLSRNLHRPRNRRVRAPISASACRRSWSRGATTSCCPPGGPRSSPSRSRMDARW
ncbi:alpha/beta hydrolase family protein [Mycobacterium kansasii 732]|nr:alpha/beta hydrolase family protein [Mycobacterium kansasii 732]